MNPITEPPPQPAAEAAPAKKRRRLRFGRRFGDWFVNLPAVRDRVPLRYRATLYLETLYNIGSGAFICLFLISGFVVETTLGGSESDLAILAAMFGGSSLLSPLVSYLGGKLPMKSLVTMPNIVVAGLLVGTFFSFGGATVFALLIGFAFVFRVFPRVAEMNMYRVNYPVTHRGAAVGWTKAVSGISALIVTVGGYWWVCDHPEYYWLLYWVVAVMLLIASLSYWCIPVSRRSIFVKPDRLAPHRAFLEGLKVVVSDKRFLLFQFGFALAGFANHMAMIYVVRLLKTDVIGSRPLEDVVPASTYSLLVGGLGLDRETAITAVVGFIFAVLPIILMMLSAAFWGRFLDRINPMNARALFNTFQTVAYGFHAYGGVTLQIWPILVGSILHAIGNGGGTINWLTGSLYFASEDRVSLYNAVHVGLTGIRGMIAPLVGLYLLTSDTIAPLGWFELQGAGLGANMFWIACGLSLAGVLVMGIQGMLDPGPRES